MVCRSPADDYLISKEVYVLVLHIAIIFSPYIYSCSLVGIPKAIELNGFGHTKSRKGFNELR